MRRSTGARGVRSDEDSTILISAGATDGVYRNVKEVPPPLRKQLLKSTSGLNAATILIADRRGRHELAKAIRISRARCSRSSCRRFWEPPETGPRMPAGGGCSRSLPSCWSFSFSCFLIALQSILNGIWPVQGFITAKHEAPSITAPVPPVRNRPLLPGTWKNLFYPPERDEYTYFERAGSAPFIGATLVVKAAWAADASMLAHGRFGKSLMPQADFSSFLQQRAGFTGIQRIGNWSAFGTQGYFSFNNDFAMLAFRGTEADDPLDAIADLDVLLVDEHDFRTASDEAHLGLRHLSLVEELVAPVCKVHQGFQRALNEVWEQVHACVTDYRKAYPAAEICFTGHSLGAALATLAEGSTRRQFSLYLRVSPCRQPGVLRSRIDRSGCGRPVREPERSDRARADESRQYRHAPRECIRIDEHGVLTPDEGSFKGDLQALAMAIAGLPKTGVLLFPDTPAPEGLVDHSPARYCIRLWNCV